MAGLLSNIFTAGQAEGLASDAAGLLSGSRETQDASDAGEGRGGQRGEEREQDDDSGSGGQRQPDDGRADARDEETGSSDDGWEGGGEHEAEVALQADFDLEASQRVEAAYVGPDGETYGHATTVGTGFDGDVGLILGASASDGVTIDEG